MGTRVEKITPVPGDVPRYDCWYQHITPMGPVWHYSQTTLYCADGSVARAFEGCPSGNPPPSIECPPKPPEVCDDGGVPRTENPILLADGTKYKAFRDYQSGGAEPLGFTRYYNSRWQRASSLGAGWTTNFDSWIDNAWTKATVALADGGRITFDKLNGWKPPSDIGATIYAPDSSTLALRTEDETVRTYETVPNTNGLRFRLVSIRKRSGYEQTLTYDADGKLATVTDTHGRTLQFAWDDTVLDSVTVPGEVVFGFSYQRDSIEGRVIPGTERLVGVTRSRPDGTEATSVTYLYEDPANRTALTGIIDENGARAATWGYGPYARATLSERAGGADRTTVSYDDAARTRTVTNALGLQDTYSFAFREGRNKLIRVDRAATLDVPAASRSLTYNANGLVASRSDWTGSLTTYAYNSRGLQTSRTEAAGTSAARTITTEWHPTFRLPTKIVAPGRTTDMSYDGSGRLTQRSVTDTTGLSAPGEDVRTWTYAYTPEGLLDTLDGPRTDVADVTDYDYDPAGNPTGVTNALGHQTRITAHDGRGLPLTVIDPNGITTDLAYDIAGRLLSRRVDPGPNEAVTTFGYDPAGNLTSVAPPDGQTLTYVYDPARRLTEVHNDLGEKIVYTLDAEGNREKEETFSATGALQRTQSRVFDELGRLLRDIGAAGQTTAYAYDSNGNLASATDPVGAVTQHAYDALNRLIATTDHLQGETNYAYDARDNLVGVDDPRGVVTTYRRNGFGEVVALESPDSGVTVTRYDPAGNPTRREDAAGAVTQYAYDALNRVTAKTFPGDPALDVTYGYDDLTPGRHGIGRPTRVDEATGWAELSYDARGNVTLERRNIGGIAYDTAYAYDLADRLVETTYPSGRIVTYERDALGRVSAVTTRADELAPEVTLAGNIAYKPFGPLVALDYGNGQALDLAYDLDYHLTDLDTSDGFTPVQDLAYGYDPAGNVTGIADNLDLARDQSFVYDALHRLTQASGLYGQIDYGYDATGNRESRTVSNGTSLTETYFNDLLSNRLESLDRSDATSRAFAYNQRGDTVRDARPDGAVTDLAYDAAGRLAAAARDGAALANYRFNARGERVAKVAGGRRTHSLYDTRGQLLAEYDAGAASATPVPPAPEATLDNTDPGAGATGGWTSAAERPGYLGTDYAEVEGGTSSDVFTWTPTVPAAGSYQVFARWPADANRGSSATYTVTHQAGSTPGRAPRRFAYGHIREDGKDLYVTSGLGTSIIPVRFNMPPEIALVTIAAP
jgi:YD repeat-containing protein